MNINITEIKYFDTAPLNGNRQGP